MKEYNKAIQKNFHSNKFVYQLIKYDVVYTGDVIILPDIGLGLQRVTSSSDQTEIKIKTNDKDPISLSARRKGVKYIKMWFDITVLNYSSKILNSKLEASG